MPRAPTRLFVEQLTVLDAARLDAARGLVGESWIVDVELEGELDAQSMLVDFGEVKRRLKRAIDQNGDHSLLVPARAPQLSLHRTRHEIALRFAAATGAVEHVSPPQAVTLIDADRVDAATLARHLQTRLARELPPNVAALSIRLRHERIAGARYHYSHGLKKHTGRCQRIAHGHRSRLEIRIDGRREPRIEAQWAQRWRDIYLGTREDRVLARNGRWRFEYVSGEGRYALELPASRCDLLDADSTVERIAAHLARRVAAQRPGAAVEVRAYEGVMKGAVARAGART
ncbi:MAG: 6-carboxytetrahydropterin synthase [Nevskia sp.]|nr:6-carboxytetrahydropterin synthase [Nevskia sp.]